MGTSEASGATVTIEGETMTAADNRFGRPEATEVALVGAKAAGLARLRSAGFEVPERDRDTHPLHRRAGGPNRTMDRHDGLSDALAEVTAELGERLAVRSSATWEDSATSAHAGETATELDVSGADDLAVAIGRCVRAS